MTNRWLVYVPGITATIAFFFWLAGVKQWNGERGKTQVQQRPLNAKQQTFMIGQQKIATQGSSN